MPTATINDSTIHYTQKGQGKPLVLVHGFPLDSRIWSHQVEALSSDYRVIAPDLHAFGQSRASRPSTLRSMAEDLRALLQQLDALPCALAGLSMGGYVALEYSKMCPTDIQALILVDTKAEADTSEAKEARTAMIELVRSQGARAVAEGMMPKMVAPAALSKQRPVVATLRQIMESQSPQAIEWALAAMRDRQDFVESLKSIADPALVIVGEHDAITPPSLAQKLSGAIPRSQLAVIPDAGHMSPIENPQAVTEAIRSFLKACY